MMKQLAVERGKGVFVFEEYPIQDFVTLKVNIIEKDYRFLHGTIIAV